MIIDTDLDKYHTIDSIIDSYNKAQDKVAEAFDLLQEAKQLLTDSVGEDNSYNKVLPRNCCCYNLHKEAKQAKRTIKKNVWNYIIKKTQVENILSEKRKRELEKQVENNELPEITHETVHDFILNLSNSMDILLEESIKETYNLLMPRKYYGEKGYKTNSEYKVNNKVILDRVIDFCFGIITLNYFYEQKFRSLDNTFHLLDGKGPIKYPNDIVTFIRQAMQEKKWECETEYFSFKWFKKGSIHIVFKRDDLVIELNKIGGKDKLNKK